MATMGRTDTIGIVLLTGALLLGAAWTLRDLKPTGVRPVRTVPASVQCPRVHADPCAVPPEWFEV